MEERDLLVLIAQAVGVPQDKIQEALGGTPKKPASLDHLGTTPLPARAQPPPPDLTDLAEAADAIAEINELLDHDRYQFAAEVLTGIRDTIDRKKAVSAAQKRAISNIKAGGDRHAQGAARGSRRYEGYR